MRPPSDPAGALSSIAPSPQAADTDQSSAADARATQPQQSNVAIVIRINSPGDDTISQTNTISVDATSANESATDQAQAQQPVVAAALAAAQRQAEPARTSASPSVDATPAVATGPAPQAPGRGRAVLADYARSSASTAAGTASTHEPAVRHVPASARRAPPPARPHRPVFRSSRGSSPRAAPAPPRPEVAAGAVSAAAIATTAAHGVGRVLALAAALGGGGRAAASLGLAAEPGARGPTLATLLGVLLAGAFAWTLLAWAPRRPVLLRPYRRG